MKIAVALLFILTFVVLTTAQLANPLSLVSAVAIYVEHTEQEPYECEPDKDALADEAELILRRAGITIGNREAWTGFATNNAPSLDERLDLFHSLPHLLGITTAAIYTGGMCAFNYALDLHRPEMTMQNAILPAIYFTNEGVWLGTQENVTSALREEVQETVTELANKLLEARQVESR